MFRLSLITTLLICILLIRFLAFYNNQSSYTNGQEIRFTTTLFSDPAKAGMFQRISAHLSNGERVFITAPAYPSYSYGQTIVIHGKLEVSEKEGRNVYSMFSPKITFSERQNDFLRFLAPPRARIIWLFTSSLPQPSANLLLGIVFGIQEGMPKDFDEALQKAGVLHVIAASGMNVTMIAAFLSILFGSMVRRQYALILTIGAIFAYAALAGFSASIVRASIMGILAFVGQLLGRQTLALYGLFVTAFVMLLLSPYLLFDTGFALSFMATLGLIVFSPLIQMMLHRKGMLPVLLAKTDFSTTFIAQMATLPILLGTFGSISPVGILVNVLVLWTIPLLMIIGGIGALIGLILPSLGQWIFYLALPFLYYFEAMVWLFGRLPLGVTIEHLSWPITAGYYCVLLALAIVVGKTNAYKPPEQHQKGVTL